MMVVSIGRLGQVKLERPWVVLLVVVVVRPGQTGQVRAAVGGKSPRTFSGAVDFISGPLAVVRG